MVSLSANLRSPLPASTIYNSSGYPRMRNIFMVRFQPNGLNPAMANLTFVVKHCDRPKITMKSEELNQYNKRRHIYTGFRLEPIKMTFYDSANGAAQNMWTQYSQYYFGDFAAGSNKAFIYDVTSPSNYMRGNGFGLTEGYGNDSTPDAEWFFERLEIYHFYTSDTARMFDSYFLYKPRITAYEPDELDYESSAISQISMSFVYENLQYNPAQQVNDQFDEFSVRSFFAGSRTAI
ncbi:MAG: hypothetical protein NVSMB40_20070 [Aquirhabdus sp.]